MHLTCCIVLILFTDISQLPLYLVRCQQHHPIKTYPIMIFKLKLVLHRSIRPHPPSSFTQHLLNNKQLVILNLSQMVHHLTPLCIKANETMLQCYCGNNNTSSQFQNTLIITINPATVNI